MPKITPKTCGQATRPQLQNLRTVRTGADGHFGTLQKKFNFADGADGCGRAKTNTSKNLFRVSALSAPIFYVLRTGADGLFFLPVRNLAQSQSGCGRADGCTRVINF